MQAETLAPNRHSEAHHALTHDIYEDLDFEDSLKPQTKPNLETDSNHNRRNLSRLHKKPSAEFKSEVKDTISGFSRKMGYVAMCEVLTGLIHSVASNFRSDSIAYTLESVVEYLYSKIIAYRDGLPDWIKQTVVPIADYISADGAEHGHHCHHGIDPDLDISEVQDVKEKEKLVALLSFVSAGLGLVYSQLKTFFSPDEEKENESGVKFFIKTIMPILQSWPMFSAGAVKSLHGNLVNDHAAQNNAIEDYICGGQALTLSAVSILNRINPRLSKWTEYLAGTGLSLMSITNALKGLGWINGHHEHNHDHDCEHSRSAQKKSEAKKKYKVRGFEKSGVFGNIFYDPMKVIMRMFNCNLLDRETLLQAA